MRVGFVEKREEFFGSCPRRSRDADHRFERVFRRCSAGWRRRLEEIGAPSVVGNGPESGDHRSERVQSRERCGLGAVERIEQNFAPFARRGIHQVGSVARRDAQLPSGFPEIDSPLINRAEVNAEATVVISLTTTFPGGLVPRTDSMASFFASSRATR